MTIVKNWNHLSHISTRIEVEQNKENILSMLSDILIDLDEYILNGTIKTASMVKVLSGEMVNSLIQRNLIICKKKQSAPSDNDFSNEVTLWWRYAKNDYPEEKMISLLFLSRNNLLF